VRPDGEIAVSARVTGLNKNVDDIRRTEIATIRSPTLETEVSGTRPPLFRVAFSRQLSKMAPSAAYIFSSTSGQILLWAAIECHQIGMNHSRDRTQFSGISKWQYEQAWKTVLRERVPYSFSGCQRAIS
jgi:hypothetical protein